MTLPKNVAEALAVMDDARDEGRVFPVDCWQTICAHLLSQDAEIARLNAECMQHLRQAMENGRDCNRAESRLAAADALLRDILDSYCASPQLHARIAAHLSENTHG